MLEQLRSESAVKEKRITQLQQNLSASRREVAELQNQLQISILGWSDFYDVFNASLLSNFYGQ